MTPEQELLYGGAVWLGPLFLIGFLLLVGWLVNAPLTEWGARRIKRRQEKQLPIREQMERARALRLYTEGKGPQPKWWDELMRRPRQSWSSYLRRR